MQDIWHEYVYLFSHSLVALQVRFSPCTAFWPGSAHYSRWQAMVGTMQLDRTSRQVMLSTIFEVVELRCGQPHERQSLESFRSSPFLRHAARTRIVYINIDYVYDPYTVSSVAHDYPNVEEIHIIIKAPLERRDRIDLTTFVRQMQFRGKLVTLTPAWTLLQARHRSDILFDLRPAAMSGADGRVPSVRSPPAPNPTHRLS